MDNTETQPLLHTAIPPQYGIQWVGPSSSSANMENPPIGVSQQHLVEDNRGSEQGGKKIPQFIAALCATLGALSTGTVLGWSSPANSGLPADYFDLVDDQFSWVSSLSTLGCASVCIPIGFIMDKLGRKPTMLLLVIPFTGGWLLLLFAKNVSMLYAGRFIVGIAGGAFCITAPTYTSEIAQDNVRGTLGSLFQLMVTIGILYAYVLGGYLNFFVFNILCLIIPLIFGLLFFFMPETPYFYLSKGRREDAIKSLIWLRGDQYDIESEIDDIQKRIDSTRDSNISFIQTFSKKSVLKTIFICYSVMFFQQFSGINAVLFNVEKIFESADTGMEGKISAIIIGAIQVGATLVSTLVVDRLGRKVLLLVSAFMMCLCGIALGVFFYIQTGPNADPTLAESLSWLPLTSLCIFIITFSLGYGPIPWMLASELCTPEIKALVSSTAGTFNWVLAFIITFTYESMTKTMYDYGVFWFFASVMALNVVFVAIFVFETKGKSNEEIQTLLGATAPGTITRDSKAGERL